MRYFYYTNQHSGLSTVIIVDENSPHVGLYPSKDRYNYSTSRRDWLFHYGNLSTEEKRNMFEICENQFKKFKENGTIPNNWDW